MAAFEYQAVDARGKNTKGLVEADTPRQVRAILRERGLIPMDVKQVAERSESGRASLFQRGFSTAELALFTRQLSTLTRSGLPLDDALQAVSEQTESKQVKRTALAVRASVAEGETFARSLAKFPASFDGLYRSTVEAGEHSAHLDLVLERLADYVESSQEMRRKIVNQSIYPIILVFVVIAVVVLLMSFVVPKMVATFESSGQDLPGLTIGLIAVSDFFQAHSGKLLIGLCLFAVAWKFAMRNQAFAYRVHRARLRMPLIGRQIRAINTARFTRTLSILNASGVKFGRAMQIASGVVSNMPMREAIDEATKRIQEGSGIARSLSASKLFPPIALHLIASGEQSSKLDEMLERAAVNQEREAEQRISAFMSIFAPFLILFMGLFVLIIVLAVLMPVFNITNLVE